MSEISSVNNGLGFVCANNDSAKKVETEKSFLGRLYSTTTDGFRSEGFLGDLLNAMRLTRFYSEQVNDGVATKEAVAITESAALVKNYLGALSAPEKFGDLFKDVSALATDGVSSFNEGVQSVSNVVASFFVAAKTLVDGLEASASIGLVGRDVVATYKPFGLMGTATHGAREALSKDIPGVYKNCGKDNVKVSFNLLKLIKNVSLVGVGCFALVAIYFKVALAPWLIPVLLTASVTTSVASRFIKGLLIDGESKPAPAA